MIKMMDTITKTHRNPDLADVKTIDEIRSILEMNPETTDVILDIYRLDIERNPVIRKEWLLGKIPIQRELYKKDPDTIVVDNYSLRFIFGDNKSIKVANPVLQAMLYPAYGKLRVNPLGDLDQDVIDQPQRPSDIDTVEYVRSLILVSAGEIAGRNCRLFTSREGIPSANFFIEWPYDKLKEFVDGERSKFSHYTPNLGITERLIQGPEKLPRYTQTEIGDVHLRVAMNLERISMGHGFGYSAAA